MLSVVIRPFISIKRHFGGRRKAMTVDSPPPPVDSINEMSFGPYSWKAIVESRDKNGEVDRTFIGYSQNMTIVTKTQVACDRYKLPGMVCGEATLIMKGGECDEVVFMKSKNGKLLNLTNPFQ